MGSDTFAEAPAQSVAKPPGSISVTLTPNGLTSWARAWLKPSSPHFDAWYSPTVGNAETPPIDETWMMCPAPRPRREGRAAWVTHSAPKVGLDLGPGLGLGDLL